jgi:hypothetical protein
MPLPWHACRTRSIPSRPPRFFARASRPSMPSAILVRAQETWSPSTGSADSAISASSLRLGFRTVAVNRGRDKEKLARSLGAHEYIDSAASDPAQALQAMGVRKRLSPR